MIQTIDDSILKALDHFISNVFPNLFKGNTESKEYKRVFGLVAERRKMLAGKGHKLTEKWIISILGKFGGKINGKPRYTFKRVTTVTIEIPEHESE